MAEPTALSFYQLIGAPLYALIEAESYAADATAQFIERVGFERAADRRRWGEAARRPGRPAHDLFPAGAARLERRGHFL